ncbi:MAG: hypothetical protein ABIP35_07600 [Ginsengibacter sp.]
MKTLTIKPYFVKDEARNYLGFFQIKNDFDKLQEELEVYENIKAYDKAENCSNKEFIH